MSELAYTSIGAPARPPVYFLHGFLGSGRNWTSFARRLVDLRSDWRAVLVDLRLHGESQGIGGPHTVAGATSDVVALIGTSFRSGPAAVLGHSFGGKVAMEVTRRLSPPPVSTWIIDSTPAPGGADGAAARMLARLETSPASFADRDAAVAWVVEGGFSGPTARWVALNLERAAGGWSWRLDTVGLRELLTDFVQTDCWPVFESPPPGASLHVVRASEGSILAADHVKRIDALSARGEPVTLHELEGGHWLHVDNPDGLVELMAGLLPRVP